MDKTAQIEKLLQFLLESLQETKDFTLSEGPKFIQEFLTWTLYNAIFGVVISALFILFGWLIWRMLTKRIEKLNYRAEKVPWHFLRAVLGIGNIFIGGLILIFNISTVIKVLVAPRLVIIEMIKSLK